jgi:Protein of unknown function (DUF1698)
VFKRLARRLAGQNPWAADATTARTPRAAVLDQYTRKAPDPQNALDLFKGGWLSTFPEPWSGLHAGQMPLFDDARIKWAIQALGGVEGRTVLELGPLEGGHTYLLEKAGAQSVVAIEARSRAYLKCLIAKEIVGLRRARFLYGDFEEYLRSGPGRFDVVIGSGVLYHVRNPVELIHNLARVTDRVYLWTHFFVRERLAAIPHMAHRVGGSHAADHSGFRHTLHRYNYGDVDPKRFTGGTQEFSHWLNRDDLLGALRHAGFDDIHVGEEYLEHVNGPCISLVARRRGG